MPATPHILIIPSDFKQFVKVSCSFYPLYLCNEEMSIDYEHFQSYATMSATPHILIIPSDFKQFVKVTIVRPLVQFNPLYPCNEYRL